MNVGYVFSRTALQEKNSLGFQFFSLMKSYMACAPAVSALVGSVADVNAGGHSSETMRSAT